MNVQKMLSSLFVSFFLIFAGAASADTGKMEDGLIVTKIVSQIAMDPSLSIFKINVSSVNGVVSLTGNVNSDTDAAAAVQLAQSTSGVVDVNASGLTVKNSQQPLADTFITAKIKGMFIQDKLFHDTNVAAMTISVETNNGVVYLSGKADSQEQINNAIKIAKSVNGVKSVESRIETAGSTSAQ